MKSPHPLLPNVSRLAALLAAAALLWGCEEHVVETTGSAPEIVGFFALPTATLPGGEVKVTVEARDADGDDIEYRWAATGGELEGGGATVTWKAPHPPADSVYQVEVRVTDNRHGSASSNLEIFVIQDTESEPCTVPCAEIIRVGPPRCTDCIGMPSIPGLTNPPFVAADHADADYLTEETMVIGLRLGAEVRAYPVLILNRHEVVNDEIGGERIVVTYCPFTASALVFRRQLDASTAFDFDVSGFLYNSNLILYDLAGQTLWSQMRMEAIRGKFLGRKLSPLPAFFMTWGAWKSLYPQTQVLSENTGYGKNYAVDQYARYNDSPSIWAPVNPLDGRLPVKERIFGVALEGEQKAYAFDRLGEMGLFRDTVGGSEVLVVWYRAARFAAVYSPQTSAGTSDFVLDGAASGSPFTLRDALTGSRWDLTGRAIDGPLAGEELQQVLPSYPAFWFAWAAFWPGTEIVEER